MITAAAGVLLTPQDAAYLVGAYDELVRVLAEHGGPQPALRLTHTIGELRRATRKCGAECGGDTSGPSSQADETRDDHDPGYVTVSTEQAAHVLGVGPSAVRGMAQRDPAKLGSVRVRGRWRHDRTRVYQRAARQQFRLATAEPQGLNTNVIPRTDPRQ